MKHDRLLGGGKQGLRYATGRLLAAFLFAGFCQAPGIAAETDERITTIVSHGEGDHVVLAGFGVSNGGVVLQLHVPKAMRAEWQSLTDETARQDWIAGKLREQHGQGRAVSGDALGMLYQCGYGTTVPRDRERALEFMSAAMEAKRFLAPRAHISLLLAGPDPLKALRVARPWIVTMLQNNEWKAIALAGDAIALLSASQDAHEQEQAKDLFREGSGMLLRLLAEKESSKELARASLVFCRRMIGLRAFAYPGSHLDRVDAVVDAAEKAFPGSPLALDIRFSLAGIRDEPEKLARFGRQLLSSGEPKPLVMHFYLEALRQGVSFTDADLIEAEEVVKRWLDTDPESLASRMELLRIQRMRSSHAAVLDTAADVLRHPSLSDEERDRAYQWRFEAAIWLGRPHALNQDDFEHQLKRASGFLLVMGAAWLAMVGLLTRRRTKPVSIWINGIWLSTMAYIPLLLLASPLTGIVAAAIGTVWLLYSVSGTATPLGYLRQPTRADSGCSASWLSIVGLCCGLFLAVQAFSALHGKGIESLFGRPPQPFLSVALTKTSFMALAGAVAVGGLLIPLLEEIIFRGFCQDWLGRKLPMVWAVIVISAWFGLVHGPAAALPTAVMGALFSWLRIRYDSLWPPILFHAMNNTLAILWINASLLTSG